MTTEADPFAALLASLYPDAPEAAEAPSSAQGRPPELVAEWSGLNTPKTTPADTAEQWGEPEATRKGKATNGADAPFADEGEAADAAWESRVTPALPSWFRDAPPPRKWLLRDPRVEHSPGVFPLGKVGQLVAEGGIGKTMLLCQLALSVATGTRWLDTLDVAAEGVGRVLLALGEEDAEEVRRRLHYAARAAHVAEPPTGSIVTLPLSGVTCPMIEKDAAGNPVDAPFLIWLRRYLAREHWRLVILDPLTRFAGLDAEIDNAIATRFVQATESLVDAARGAAVLDAHHTNKLSRSKGKVETASARGSTALTDGARIVWTMGYEDVPEDEDTEGLDDVIVLAHTKSNYSKKATPILLRRSDEYHGALVPLDAGDEERVRRAKEKPFSKRTAAREAHTDERRAKRAADDMAARQARTAKAEADRRTRDAEDDEAARAIVAVHPEAPVRDVVALLRKARACGGDRAHAATVRVRGTP